MKIYIESIKINTRKRAIDETKVKDIAESIQYLNLLNPITVSNSNDGYQLIAGLHRLKACELLGMTEIEANVVELSELNKELAEIDENLMRCELHYIERGEHFMRRKKIYELQNPSAKQGGDRKSEEVISKRNNFGLISSFAQDTASKLNISERTIQQEIKIAENLTLESKQAIKELDIPKTEAIELARLEPEQQKSHLEKMVAKNPKKKVQKIEVQVSEQKSTESDEKALDEQLIELLEKLHAEYPNDWEEKVQKCMETVLSSIKKGDN